MSCPVIELTQQLIRRPSLSPDDAGCQALLIERLQAIGFTVERMDFADTIVGSIRRLNRPFVTACYSGAARQI